MSRQNRAGALALWALFATGAGAQESRPAPSESVASRPFGERLKFSAEARYRLERWRFLDDSTLSAAGLRRNYDFHALRLLVRASLTEGPFTFYGAAQDVHLWSLPDNATGGPGATYFANSGGVENPDELTLFHLWAEAKDVGVEGLRVRVGRQELGDGGSHVYEAPKWNRLRALSVTERLVGSFGWSQASRTFDGARALFDRPEWFGQAYYAGVNAGGFDVDDSTDSVHHFSIGGGDLVAKAGTVLPDTELRLIGVYAKDHRAIARTVAGDPIDVVTIGAGAVGIYGAGPGQFDFVAWLAGQRGDFGALDQRGWARVVEGGYQWTGVPLKPWLRLGWTWASGDRDPSDGDNDSFFNVVPTNHKYYGYADLAALSNLSDAYGQLFLHPAKNVTLETDFHFFSVADRLAPAVFGSGAFNDETFGYGFRPTNGDRTLGREIDLLATWRATPAVDVAVGWSIFLGGAIYENLFDGENVNFLYAQTTVRF